VIVLLRNAGFGLPTGRHQFRDAQVRQAWRKIGIILIPILFVWSRRVFWHLFQHFAGTEKSGRVDPSTRPPQRNAATAAKELRSRAGRFDDRSIFA